MLPKIWRGSNLQGSNPCRWGVLQQPRHKVYSFWRGPSTEHLQNRHWHKSSKLAETHLWPGVGFDLGELELCVVGVHLLYLLSSGGAQHLGWRFCQEWCWTNIESNLRRFSKLIVRWTKVEYLDDFHKLVHSAITRENRLENNSVRIT